MLQSLVLVGIVLWESALPSQCIAFNSPTRPRSYNYPSIRLEYCAWKATGTLAHASLCDSKGTIVHRYPMAGYLTVFMQASMIFHVLALTINSHGREIIPCDTQIWILKITNATGIWASVSMPCTVRPFALTRTSSPPQSLLLALRSSKSACILNSDPPLIFSVALWSWDKRVVAFITVLYAGLIVVYCLSTLIVKYGRSLLTFGSMAEIYNYVQWLGLRTPQVRTIQHSSDRVHLQYVIDSFVNKLLTYNSHGL